MANWIERFLTAIATHKSNASAHHSRYLNSEASAVAAGLISTHAGLPTVHQDAPALILTHKGDASAHHNNANDPSAGQKAALPGTSGTPSGSNKYVTNADPRNTNARTPAAHTLASHSTKAHSELSDAPESAHHTKFTTTEHSSIGNGAPHHTKYTNSAAKAAAVQSGTITNGVTKAPTHDAVFDVKATADAAQTAAEVDADILTHKNIAAAHHTKFTTTEHTAIGNGAPHHTKYTDSAARAAAVSDAAYGAGWNGVTTIAPSKNAVYDKIETLGGATIATGSYSGNSNASRRQITVGFKCSVVIVIGNDDYSLGKGFIAVPSRTIRFMSSSIAEDDGTGIWPGLHASDGFEVSGNTSYIFNFTGRTYYYWAISE